MVGGRFATHPETIWASACLLVETIGVLGPSAEMNDVQEAIHQNRLLGLYTPGAEGGERWELEADPCHVEILISQMGPV